MTHNGANRIRTLGYIPKRLYKLNEYHARNQTKHIPKSDNNQSKSRSNSREKTTTTLRNT